MLAIGHILFGIVGAETTVSPVVIAIATGRFAWLLALIPAFLVSKGFYALSGFCKAKAIEKSTGLNISSQVDTYRMYE